MQELAEGADAALLVRMLSAEGLLALGGRRLRELPQLELPDQLNRAAEEALAVGRRRGLLWEAVTLRLVDCLERAGIACLPIKGPLFAARVHGDPGLRPSGDIDLLVSDSDLARGARLISRNGYGSPIEHPAPGELPRLHLTLRGVTGALPPVELHWRLHWYESSFARRMLKRSERDSSFGRVPRPADELAALLLFFARDGFTGVRLAADVAAWWDALGGELEPGGLQQVVDEHPELERAITVAAGVAEEWVGLPAGDLLDLRLDDARIRLTRRLSNWSRTGDLDQLAANIALVDWLLQPSLEPVSFARRQLVLDATGAPPAPPLSTRVLHAPKRLLRFALALWRVRRGRRWAPLPQLSAT